MVIERSVMIDDEEQKDLEVSMAVRRRCNKQSHVSDKLHAHARDRAAGSPTPCQRDTSREPI